MLCVDTRDDWTAATVDVTINGVTLTYTPAASVHGAYDWMVGFDAWIEAQNFGGVSVVCDWTWSVEPVIGPWFLVTFDQNGDLNPSLAASNLVGALNDAFVAGMVMLWNDGTWIVGAAITAERSLGRWAVANLTRWSQDAGDGGSWGAVLPFVGGTVGRGVSIAGVLSPVQFTRLHEILLGARNPRAAWVYDAAAGWLRVSLGEASYQAAGRQLTTVSFACAGEAWS